MGKVIGVSFNQKHNISKNNCDYIKLLEGLGVEGDAHMGETVKHRSRVKKNPNLPNLRQVHLIHSELHLELKNKGFDILPGEMGENITTSEVDLLALPTDTCLCIGDTAIVKITGLRNPCIQLNRLKKGLMKAVLDKDENGNIIRKSGVMGVVVAGGIVKVGDNIKVIFPDGKYQSLVPV